jgi:hypothetical protein
MMIWRHTAAVKEEEVEKWGKWGNRAASGIERR